MQTNRNGIRIVNMQITKHNHYRKKFQKKQRTNFKNFNKPKLTRSVLDKQAILKERQKDRYAELTKVVAGLEESTHVAVGSHAYLEALQDQFQVVREWEVSICQH